MLDAATPSPTPHAIAVPMTQDTARTPFRWHLFNRHLTTVAGVVLILAVGAIIAVGLRPIQANANRVLGDRPITLQFIWPKVHIADQSTNMTWIPRAWQERLLAQTRQRVASLADPLDPKVLTDLSAFLGASGWFEAAPTVRRTGTNGIVIEGEWRTPAAVVRYRPTPGVSEQLLWLSSKGYPMPKVADPGNARPRVIVGPKAGPPTTPGGQVDFDRAWPGDDVAAGLELLALVGRQTWANQVAGVDVSEYASKECLSLLTTYGTRVVWGGKPSKPRYGDAPTRQKLHHIATLKGDTRRIDAGHQIVYVDSFFLMFDRTATEELRRKQAGEGPSLLGPEGVQRPEPSTTAKPEKARTDRTAPGGKPSKAPKGAKPARAT